MPFDGFIRENGFEAAEELCEGASGRAFKAYDPQLHRHAFIKYYETAESDVELILEEPRKIVSIFTHNGMAANHIAIVYGANLKIFEGAHYVEMITEFCQGNSLYSKIAGDRMMSYDAIDFAKQMIDGLHVLHQRKIVHRDLKPSNLVISGQNLKIIDLGAAAEIRTGQTFLTSRSKHSIFYRPPEAFDPTNIYGTFSDIYQVGLILYEMINGPIDESPLSYIDQKILKREELRLGKQYSQMLDYEKSDVQDSSIKFLAQTGKLLEKARKPTRLYEKTISPIVRALSHPNYLKRFSKCSDARTRLSRSAGPNWKEEIDGSITVCDYNGRDYTAREYTNHHNVIKFECASSMTGSTAKRKNNSITSWPDFEKHLRL